MSELLNHYLKLDNFFHEKLQSVSISGRAHKELYDLNIHTVNDLFDANIGSLHNNGSISDNVYMELASYEDFINAQIDQLGNDNGNPLSRAGTVLEKINSLPDDEYVYLGSKSGWMTVQLCSDLRQNLDSVSEKYKDKYEKSIQPKKNKDGTYSMPSTIPIPFIDFKDRKMVDVYVISALDPKGFAIKMTGDETGDSSIGLTDDSKADAAAEKAEEKAEKAKKEKLAAMKKKKTSASKKQDNDYVVDDSKPKSKKDTLSDEWAAVTADLLDGRTKTTTEKKRDKIVINYKKRKTRKEESDEGFTDSYGGMENYL